MEIWILLARHSFSVIFVFFSTYQICTSDWCVG